LGVTIYKLFPDIIWVYGNHWRWLDPLVLMQVTKQLHPPGGAYGLPDALYWGSEKVKAFGYLYVFSSSSCQACVYPVSVAHSF
jgi:hypothetical protein